MQNYDAIVLGVGGVGSAALYQLALRGLKTLGIDRFPPGHDRGSSHGQTRIIRQAYFEHPDYVPLLKRAYQLWSELEQTRGEQLFFPVGLLQIGPPDGPVVSGVRRSAATHGLMIEDWTPTASRDELRGFVLPDGWHAVFERSAGYLLVERCVVAYVAEAERLGAELRIGDAIDEWRWRDQGFVVTAGGNQYFTPRLVIAAGPWASQWLADLKLPLRVVRKSLFWWRASDDSYRADRGCPAFLFDTPAGCYYGFPQLDERGVKTAEHSGGDPIDDPLTVDRRLDVAEKSRVEAFAARHLPRLSTECLDHAVCMYTMSPDEHFIVDRHPDYPRLAYAAGLSGHGFKFTSVLGETLADWVVDGHAQSSVGFLSAARLRPRSIQFGE